MGSASWVCSGNCTRDSSSLVIPLPSPLSPYLILSIICFILNFALLFYSSLEIWHKCCVGGWLAAAALAWHRACTYANTSLRIAAPITSKHTNPLAYTIHKQYPYHSNAHLRAPICEHLASRRSQVRVDSYIIHKRHSHHTTERNVAFY